MVYDERYDGLKPKRPKRKPHVATAAAKAKRTANLKPKKKSPLTAMSKEARRAENKALWREGRFKRNGAEQRAEYLNALRGDLPELYEIQKQLWREEHPTKAHSYRSQFVEAAIDRAVGRAAHTFAGSIQHHTSLDGTALDIEGAALSPLLADATAYDANATKQLRSPTKTIDVVSEPVSEQPFIVDPVGNVAAPVAASDEPEEPEPEEAQSTPPPFSGAPADPDPFPGAPADFRIMQRQKQQRDVQGDANFEYMRKRQEAARLDPQRYPGGVIPLAELRSDVEEGRMTLDQGTMEVVRFGRIPGGKGFRRV